MLFEGRRARVFFSVFLCLYTSFIFGFRGEFVGVDTPAYYRIFEIVNADITGWSKDILYVQINRLVGFFSDDPAYLTFFVALATLVNISWFIYRYSPSVFLGWVVFISVYSFFGLANGIRQNLAISIFLLAMPFIFSRSFFWFLSLVFISSLVHLSAAVSVMIYFLYYVRVGAFIYLWVWLASMLFSFESSYALSVLGYVSSLLPERFSSYASDYNVLNNHFEYGTGFGFVFMQCLALILIFSLRVLKVRERVLDESSYRMKYFFISCGVLYFILDNVFGLVPYIGRVFAYLHIILIVSIPVAVSVLFNRRSSRLFGVVLGCFLSILFIKTVLGGTAHGAFPFIVDFPFL